jgi:FtsH-binding integral membrane protein
MNFTPFSALLLLPAMIVLLQLGHALRRRRESAPQSSAIEGAVFALFGLLLAFTFSGAVTRYDAHRELVLQESNDIGTAYLRLDLLAAQDQPPLRRLFRDYVNSRLHLYDRVSSEISETTKQLQQQIWKRSVAAAAAAPGANPDATKLLLPALNDMIDITSTRQNAFNMHPPTVIFLLLFVLSGCCAFVAGYGMTATARSWFYSIALAVTVTLTVYATLEIEYPRQGLIRLTQTDDTFLQLRDSIQ